MLATLVFMTSCKVCVSARHERTKLLKSDKVDLVILKVRILIRIIIIVTH